MNIDKLKIVLIGSKRFNSNWKNKHKEEYDLLMNVTSFLDSDVTLQERSYCVLNNIQEIQKCYCGNPLSYYKGRGYSSFCSNSCMGKSEITKNKKKKTLMNNLGVEHQMYSEKVKSTIKKTNKERYGVENVFSSERIKNKIRNSNMENLGVAYPMQSTKVRKKLQETLNNKYGVKNINQRHISKHVLENFDNKNWLLNEHHTLKKSSKVIAKENGVSPSFVLIKLKEHDIELKIYGNSITEKEIVDFIKSHYTGTVLENDRTIVRPKELDIVLPDLKIAIEYCGLYWHSDVNKDVDKNYHLDKLKLCNSNGYRLITIFEDEWVLKENIVKSKILNSIGESPSGIIYARNCIIKELDFITSKSFFDDNHIQGCGSGNINYGLFNNDSLVAVISFINKKDKIYDLNRFASSCRVIGGFSKLLAHFKKNHDWNEIYTFADRRWSEGNLYLKSGFEHVYNTNPNYFYINLPQLIRYSRQKFMKHKLSKLLEKFDPNLSEYDNMTNNGYSRIYDCGNMKFLMKKER